MDKQDLYLLPGLHSRVEHFAMSAVYIVHFA
ncbi:hypothetical protein DES53_102992 [Roseimicrobium gellanilyticum]|uniref:Uncharacterized protein n=1 Tax=Roseimicrobium gellanilyticum TaxID=748857 RepID=A0A366HSD8_9BACT|nr:hypothetical protein DES53_102992 [Roseimicrobium gellanilyticum]